MKLTKWVPCTVCWGSLNGWIAEYHQQMKLVNYECWSIGVVWLGKESNCTRIPIQIVGQTQCILYFHSQRKRSNAKEMINSDSKINDVCYTCREFIVFNCFHACTINVFIVVSCQNQIFWLLKISHLHQKRNCKLEQNEKKKIEEDAKSFKFLLTWNVTQLLWLKLLKRIKLEFIETLVPFVVLNKDLIGAQHMCWCDHFFFTFHWYWQQFFDQNKICPNT